MDEELPEAVWPDIARICFGEGDPPLLNACVGGWQSRFWDMHGYIEGYRRAALELHRVAETRTVSPDVIVFPLVFLWRQHLELSLKELISVGRQLAGGSRGFPKTHSLLALWREARPLIAPLGDPTAPELANVDANIREVERMGPGSYGFRYPVDATGLAPSMPNAPDYVNLRVLEEGMLSLSNFFSGVCMAIAARRDCALQQEAAQKREWPG